MKINAVNNTDNIHFRGLGSKIAKALENAAVTLPTKTSQNRKTISIELHNAMVKLTAYRVALLFSALFGFFGYKVADKISDNDTEDFANFLENMDIDTNAPIEIKDVNSDGSVDLVIQKKDSSKVVLDLKNSGMFVESKGYKAIE